MLEFLAKGGGIALLEVNPGLVIWTFIIFGIVLFLLHRFAWHPITVALDQRAEKIHSDIDSARRLKDDAERKLTEYLQKIEELQSEGQKVLTQSRKEAEEQKEKMMAAAKEETHSLLERSKREIQVAKDVAVTETKEQVVGLAVAIASEILSRDINTKDHEKLLHDTMHKFQSIG